jgi:PPOX class probable F420-dependent enzyme
MSETDARARFAAGRVARLATVRPDGRPHVVPCCFALDRDTAYSAVDGKPKSTLALQRLANLRAHPAASLVVDHYDEDWSQLWWVRADGVARVLDEGAERERALDLLAERYEQYRAVRPPGAVMALDVATWTHWSATQPWASPMGRRRVTGG